MFKRTSLSFLFHEGSSWHKVSGAHIKIMAKPNLVQYIRSRYFTFLFLVKFSVLSHGVRNILNKETKCELFLESFYDAIFPFRLNPCSQHFVLPQCRLKCLNSFGDEVFGRNVIFQDVC